MALNLGSPGVSIKEIDLTQGAIQGVVDVTAGIAGPFERGPVNVATPIASEAELLEVFGNPSSTDNQYEYFLTASQYLSYGGNLQVVRVSGGTLSNANAPVGAAVTDLLIGDYDDYVDNHSSDTTWRYASRTPGSVGNGVKVCTIDAFGDQILSGVTTSGVTVGAAVTQATTAQYASNDGTVKNLDGYHNGIITEVGSGEVTVKYVSHVSAAGTETKLEYGPGSPYRFLASTAITVGGATGAATTTVTITARGALGSTRAVHSSGADLERYQKLASTVVDNAGGAQVGTGDTGFFVGSLTGMNTSSLLVINDEIISVAATYSANNFVAIGTDATTVKCCSRSGRNHNFYSC